MQQPMEYAPSSGAASGRGQHGQVAHPVARSGLVLGLLNGLFGILQVVTSSSGAIENHATISSFYYGRHGTGFDIAIMASWLAPVFLAAYGSCLVAFAVSMWLCWRAGRASAAASGYSAGASVAGLLVSMIGSGIWIVASVVAVLLAHTDGTLTGVLATTPDTTAAHQTVELVGLLGQEVVAAAIALGLAAIAGHIGGRSARVPPRRLPGRPLVVAMPAYPQYPPASLYPPYASGGYPLPGVPGYPPQPHPYGSASPLPVGPPQVHPHAPRSPFPPYGIPSTPPWGQPAPGDAARPQTGNPPDDAAQT
jgi:hypothetical protein